MKIWKLLLATITAGVFTLGTVSCATTKAQGEQAKSEHPQDEDQGEHPQGEHPQGEHQGEHPHGEHPQSE